MTDEANPDYKSCNLKQNVFKNSSNVSQFILYELT